MSTNSVRLHRVFAAPPERIYRAFLQPEALAKWLPPDGFTGQVHHMEPVVGGGWRMSFTNLGNGQSHSFGGKYLELVPNERLQYTSTFEDANLPGEMTTTVTLRAVFCGTDFEAVQDNIPAVIPAEMCYLGWQQSLALLARLVEANVQG